MKLGNTRTHKHKERERESTHLLSLTELYSLLFDISGAATDQFVVIGVRVLLLPTSLTHSLSHSSLLLFPLTPSGLWPPSPLRSVHTCLSSTPQQQVCRSGERRPGGPVPPLLLLTLFLVAVCSFSLVSLSAHKLFKKRKKYLMYDQIYRLDAP